MSDEFICDEEKSYHEWVANNLSFVKENKQHIVVMKKLYMEGFAAGYIYRNIINEEEQLQK
jgi:hypothetical protein